MKRQLPAGRNRRLSDIIRDGLNKPEVAALTQEQQNLLSFLTLLVDIRYRAKYGRNMGWKQGRGYKQEVLPDQTHSVDIGLEGLSSTEDV